MRIYIRHGEKKYANGKNMKYALDSPLEESAYKNIEKFGLNLVKLYGLPTVIVSSPYLRARQTSMILNSILENKVPIYCDPKISEYLGNHANKDLDVYPETKKYNPPHPETWKDLEKRTIEHFIDFTEYDLNNQTIWFVTHGTVLMSITKYLGKTYNKPPFLGTICIGCNSSTKENKRYYNIANHIY